MSVLRSHHDGDDREYEPSFIPARAVISGEMRVSLDHLKYEIDHIDERDDRGVSLANACRTFAELELIYRRPAMFADTPPATELAEDQAFYAGCAGGRK